MQISDLNPKKKNLYVCRHLENTQDIIDWALEQGLPYRVPAKEFHVTIAYSKDEVDWDLTEPLEDTLRVNGGMRKVEKLGKALVLRFNSDDLHARWAEFKDEVGCSYDFPKYLTHVTISFRCEDIELDDIEPYRGELVFGPEEFSEINDDFKSNFEEVSLTESMTLQTGMDPEQAYEIFRKSYEDQTGASWSKEKFMSRAKNWRFYGDDAGFVSCRVQRSGPKKLVGVAGNPKSILRGLDELQAEGGPVWGAVSEPLARMAKKRGMIVPSFFPGGGLLIRTMIQTIPPEVFGGETPQVNKDGSLTFNYEDVGTATKYLVGNKAYFLHALGLPQIVEKLKSIPGLRTTLRLMGLNPPAG